MTSHSTDPIGAEVKLRDAPEPRATKSGHENFTSFMHLSTPAQRLKGRALAGIRLGAEPRFFP